MFISSAQILVEDNKNDFDDHESHIILSDSDNSEELSLEDSSNNEFKIVESEDIEIIITDIPGAPPGTKDPEIVVEEDAENKQENKQPKNKWDWSYHGHDHFIDWVKQMFNNVPKHSGYDSAGLERAISYLQKIDDEISRAMRNDFEGKLVAEVIESIREEIDKGLDLLEKRLEAVQEKKKSSKNNKKSSFFGEDNSLIKEGQKITGVKGVYITAPLLISRIARICINGSVSAGHSIEEIFKSQVKEYNLDKREKAEVLELLDAMGYAIRMDCGFSAEEQPDYEEENKRDMATNFRG